MARTVEPDTAPPAETYFPLVLGPTILESTPTRYYSLRYEFKPASIDTGSPGTLHKGVENKVNVEFSNNQAGKPKVAFQGNIEDCKDMDAVIFFDGSTFRLERLHRAVKSLRHLRQGETAAALAGGGGGGSGALSPTHPNGGHANAEKNALKAHHMTENITDEVPVASKPEAAPAPAAAKKPAKRKGGSSKAPASKRQSPDDIVKEPSSEIDIEIDELEVPEPEPEPEPEHEPEPEPEPDVEPEREPEPDPKRAKLAFVAEAAAPAVEDVDILGEDTEEEIVEVLEEHSDYEIEDVDVSEDEEAEKAGGADPAATLRAQAAAAEAAGNKSSSESGSSSSDSGSGSSSSESGSDDEDSASSGDDI